MPRARNLGARLVRLAAATAIAVAAFSHSGRADQPTAAQWLLAQAAPGPENQVCFTDKEGRRHFCPPGAACCPAAKSGCCAAGSLCTDFGCAMPLQCTVCADGLRRSVQLRVKTARGLRSYVNNEMARYANCRKKVGGDCLVGDLLAGNLDGCGRLFSDQAAYQSCVARQVALQP